MLMASGANFGFRRSLPHMLGVGLGFTFMVFLVGIALFEIFELFPFLNLLLKILATLYMLWLAYKIATATAPHKEGEARGTPMSFLQACAFQWVNPKAWAMAISAISLYSLNREFYTIILVALVFGTVNLPCVSVWTYLGQEMRRFLSTKKRLQIFNYIMAFLLILSLYPILVK